MLPEAIVSVVKSDPECQKRIKSRFSMIPGGLAGGVRNFGIMLRDWNANDPETDKMVCGGIADASRRNCPTRVPERRR